MTGDSDFMKRIESAFRAEQGAKIPEVADDLNVPRERIREALRELNSEYELASSMDFRYRIITDDGANQDA